MRRKTLPPTCERLESRVLLSVDIPLGETLFTDLDGSINDLDGLSNGVVVIDGDLTIPKNARITANDPDRPKKQGATDMAFVINGSLIIEEDDDGGRDTGIFAENNVGRGNGGNIDITINDGGDLIMAGGAYISASRRSQGFGKDGGGDINITMSMLGDVTMAPGSVIEANALGGVAGAITIAAWGKITVDGMIVAGPTSNLLETSNPRHHKHTGFVVETPEGGVQRGGRITITGDAEIEVGTEGVIVSQGRDPASDFVILEGCGIDIFGLVASVAKKSNGLKPNRGDTNRVEVILRSGKHINIFGEDLGGTGPNQGRVRADYVLGEKQVPQKVSIFARNDITIKGPAAGDLYSVTSNGGRSTGQDGGTVDVVSSQGGMIVMGRALQARGQQLGGFINPTAKNDVDLSGGQLSASGGSTTRSAGGHVSVRSYEKSVLSDAATVIDVSGGAPENGTATLTMAVDAAFNGTTLPASALNPNVIIAFDLAAMQELMDLELSLSLPECEKTGSPQNNKDSTLIHGGKDRNLGGDPDLVVRSQTRTVVGFDLSQVDLSAVTSATLVMTINPAKLPKGWGKNRMIGAHALNVDFTEGNGTRATRGTGSGTAWHCATDTDISNDERDCVVNKDWVGGDYQDVATDTVKPQSNTAGTHSFDVTADVQAGVFGWALVRNGNGGKITYYSREHPDAIASPLLAPRLVIT